MSSIECLLEFNIRANIEDYEFWAQRSYGELRFSSQVYDALDAALEYWLLKRKAETDG